MHQYWLLPRCSATQKWYNHTTEVNGKTQDIKLYYSEKGSWPWSGIRVLDKECFIDLTKIFNSVVWKMYVPINGNYRMKWPIFGTVHF